jgi:hypothetical protein
VLDVAHAFAKLGDRGPFSYPARAAGVIISIGEATAITGGIWN